MAGWPTSRFATQMKWLVLCVLLVLPPLYALAGYYNWPLFADLLGHAGQQGEGVLGVLWFVAFLTSEFFSLAATFVSIVRVFKCREEEIVWPILFAFIFFGSLACFFASYYIVQKGFA